MMNIVYCDVGSLCIKCGGSYIHYNNGYGDGEFAVYIFENSFELQKWLDNNRNFQEEFVSDAFLNDAKLMSYDLCYKLESDSDLNKELATLNGWFGIYKLLENGEATGHMAIVGWGDYSSSLFYIKN